MKKIGLVGGMSWHSTLEYYRVINEQVAEELGGHASAPVALESLDFAEIRRCQLDGDWAHAARLLTEAAQRCERSGADVVIICTNLMHRVAEEVQAGIGVPLLHIADALADRAGEHGWSRLGVLGTSWVMEEDFYVGRLARHGLEVVVPDAADRREADRVIFDELTRGVVTEESRAAFVAILGRLRDRGAEAVVLGCTEIELLVGADDTPVPLLPSMRTHAEAAARAVLGERVPA
ncbi:aspartate/glutamate racemase family protein [Nocardioides halotolerans]|jgi:aspartate racemase|uniref:aspartate/glutamate racemase family protein n=1 Tax=Nocardioides halotolerans TaxID=433660 RepID=UPI0004019818|nr:aspartate/glutamate racemase family protein [Nocardioides halotolerans]